MRLTILAFLAMSAPAERPSLDAALAAAESAWGVQTAARLEWRRLNGCNKPTDTAALTTAGEHVILVNSACALDAAKLLIVVEHELGHYLGLGHSDDPASIMYWQLGMDRTITAEDRKHVAAK